MKTKTTTATRTKIFTPIGKADTLRAVYIGADCSAVALFVRRTALGDQRYAQVCTRLPNLRLSLRGTVNSTSIPRELARIVISEYDAGIITIPMATGRPITIDVWPDNGSENTRERGIKVATLSINVHGIGSFRVHDADYISGGFTLQGSGVGRTFYNDIPAQTAETLRANRAEWDGDKILRFEDFAAAQTDPSEPGSAAYRETNARATYDDA